MKRNRIRRFVDILVSLIGITILIPVYLVVLLAVLFTMGFPVFFKQERPGLNGYPFTFYKFRTMANRKDENGNLLLDAERLTEIGRFLRETSLDELPSLWNVLKGDMSLVGPRPLLMEYMDLYTSEQTRRHEVRPGITGWAQVNGRNAISWEQKFKLDVWYVDNWSLWLDIKILFLTVLKVIKREGVSQEGHISMERFMGGEPLHTDSFNNIDKQP